MRPIFSIVTPSYQSLKWIPLCVASVADQADVAFEHVIQDAGSTDGTVDWLQQDGRARAYVEKDEGMYDAINRGLRKTTGEYLAYLNSDEQYLPGTLAKVARFFEAHPQVDVLFGDALLVSETGAAISYRRTILPWRSHVRCVHLNTLTCSTFFRRRILDSGHWFDPHWRAIGDAVWVDGMLASGVRMATVFDPLAVFTFTGKNLGASETASRELCAWQGSAWLVKFSPLISLIHRIRKACAGAYRKHRVDYAIYTRDSLQDRRTFRVESLGFGWPK